MCDNACSTKEQVKTPLASTVHLIGEATVSVANGYNEILLQQKTCNNTEFTKFRKWRCLQIYAEAVTVKPEMF